MSRSLPSFYAWLPPPKQKQVPARLQPSPQRGAARRGELAPRLLGINLLLCSGALGDLLALLGCVRHPSRTTAPRSHPLAPSGTHGSLWVRALPPSLEAGPGQKGNPGLQREWWRQQRERASERASLGSRGRDTCRAPPCPLPRAAWHRRCPWGLPRPAPPGPTYSQLLAAAEKTAKTRRRSERRHERGLMVSPRAPGPRRAAAAAAGGLPSGRQVGAPRRAGWGAAPGAGRGARGGALPPCVPAALPAAAPAARRGPDCQRRPRAGMRRRRRRRRRAGCRGGGAGRGRAEDGVTWAGPAARDTPRGRAGAAAAATAASGRPSPRDWASPGSTPAGRSGRLAAQARSRHAWLRAALSGWARGAATQLPGPPPGP